MMSAAKEPSSPWCVRPLLLGLLLVVLFSQVLFGHEILVSRVGSWRYWAGTETVGTNWTQADFDDTAWPMGPAQMGYGDGDERTVLSFGADPLNKPITAYFRASFVVSNAASISNLVLSLLRDDGGAVYLNGREVFRSNLPDGLLTPDTLALSDVQGQEETIYKQGDVDPALLLEGTNILAAEIHQHSATNADLSFALEIAANVNFLSVNDVVVFEPAPGSNGISGFMQVSQSLPGTNVFVSFLVSPGTASTNDFTRNNGFLVFTPQTAERPIGFTVRSDDLVEGSETFYVQLFNPTNAVLGKATGSVTIVDYNDAPQLSIWPATVVEGVGQTQAFVAITLDPPSTNTVSVVYSTTPFTASAGLDYANGSGLVVFPPGTTSNAARVTVLGDTVPELNEVFYVRLGTPSNATVRAGAQSAAFTIVDDDEPAIQVANVAVAEGNAGNATADFYVKLQPPPPMSTVLTFGTADGSAVGGKDYRPVFGSFTFSPGSTSFVVKVEIIPNEILEPTKQFFLWFTNVTYGGAPVTATGSILNDDYPIHIELSPAREGSTQTNQVVVAVSYFLPLSSETNFYFQTVDGSAAAQLDYVPAQGTLTFGPGATNRTVTIPILPDRQPEPAEYLEFLLLDSARSNLVKKVSVLIEDDEPSLLVESQAVQRPTAGQTNILLSVSLSRPYDLPVVVSYSTSNATAQAGIDFLPVSGTIEFAPGDTVMQLPVTVLAAQPQGTWQHFFVNFQVTLTLYPGSAPVRSVISLFTVPPSFPSSFGGHVEAPGPSSRLTDLVISEIMYRHQAVFRNVPGSELDFIEIYNAGHFPADLTGYRISGSASAQFPANTVLEPGAALVLAEWPASFRAAYGTNRMVLPMTGKLPDDGGTIRLRNGAGVVLLEVDYNNQRPWPELANGRGFSLVLAKPSLGEAQPEAWLPSEEVGGNPGQWMSPSINPLRSVVINEVLANSVAPDLDFIELYNRSTQTIDISGCSLSDSPDTNKFVFVGASIAPGSYLALDEVSMGFKLKAEGDSIYFRGPGGDVLDSLRYEAQPASVSFGRFPEGGPEFFQFFPPTPFAQNNSFFDGDVVINEIMAFPPSGDARDEYIELVNRTTSAIDASGWALIKGVAYTLPTNTIIPAQGFLVIAKDVEHLRAKYPHLGPQDLLGNYSGSLADDGEDIVLARPEQRSPAGGTNLVYVTESLVDYRTFSRRWSKGGGSSLELRDPHANGRMSQNWLESIESGKSDWATLQTTGEIFFAYSPGIYEIQVLLLGEGECLIDEVQLLKPGGSNLLPNGSFEQGLTTWRFAGNHFGSIVETTSSGRALHLRSTGAGDPAGNHAVAEFTLEPPPSGTYILRASARWLAGNPKLVIRWKGQTLETSGPLPMPQAPGTPGLENSRKLEEAIPLVRNIVTTPTLPKALEPVRVAAEIVAQNLAAAALHYRLDPGSNYTRVVMNDDGLAGDLLARDGIYSALLPGQPDGTLAAFYIEIQAGPTNVLRVGEPDSDGNGEYLLRFGEQQTLSSLGGYKIWMTAKALADWNIRSRLSDELFPCAVAYRGDRLIQQARIGFAGPELDRTNTGPIGQALSAFRVVLPDGEKILGNGQVYLDPVDKAEDPTLLRQHALQWMAERVGLPPIFARFRQLTLNGVRPGSNAPIFLERTMPDRGVLKSWLEDSSQAELFEIASKVEFIPGSQSLLDLTHAALLGLSPNPSAPASAFRWNWRKIPESPVDDDYTELLGLHYAFTVPGNRLEDSVAGVIDLEEWLNVCAFVHVVGAAQTYGYDAGRNSWLYKPVQGKWRLAPGPLKDSFGSSGVHPLTYHYISRQTENAQLMSLRNYSPATRRAAALALAIGPLQSAVLDPRVALLQANGIESDPGGRAAMLNWIRQRQEYFLAPALGLGTSNQFAVSQWVNNQSLGNVVLFSGSASTDVEKIIFKSSLTGQILPAVVGWPSLNTWTAMVFTAASGTIQVSASTVYGVILSPPQSYQVFFSGSPDYRNSLVISEIMPTRNQSRSGFLEIQNPSGFPILLASWEISELAFAFPSSGVVYPGESVVLPVNRSAFVSTYGTSARVIGELGVPLSDRGGSFTIFSPASNVEADRVIYDMGPPWPQLASGQSLQVRNPRQDNSRGGNWAAFSPSPGRTNLGHTDFLTLGSIYLNELQPWNDSSFMDNAGEPDPWLEIYNGGTSTIILDSNFSLTDDYSNLTKWRFPSGTIVLPGQFLVIWMDGQTNQSAGLNIHANFRLSTNAGKIAVVQNSAAGLAILDYIHYPAVPKGQSFGSFPNGQLFQREVLSSSTPWASNAPPSIRINEWMASNQGVVFDPADNDSEDWFELYNPQAAAVSLGGYRLSDRAGNTFTIPNGTLLAAQGHLLVWADGEPVQNTTNRGQLHATFGLKASGDTITMRAPDGRIVDQIFTGSQTGNSSRGRWPDGNQILRDMFIPTPGSSNRIFNQAAPVIAPIPAQTLVAGETLRVPVSVTDLDTPVQLLTTRLGAGSPAGAMLQPGVGIVWATSLQQPPGTNWITIEAADDDIPPLVGSRTFPVTVHPPLRLRMIQSENGQNTIQFETIRGRNYVLEFKDNLGSPSWSRVNVFSNVGSSIQFPLEAGTGPQRFFRLGLLP